MNDGAYPQRRLLTVPQGAAILGMSTVQLYDRISRRCITYFKIEGGVRLRERDLLAYKRADSSLVLTGLHRVRRARTLTAVMLDAEAALNEVIDELPSGSMTTRDVAEFFQVSVATVRRLVDTRKIAFRKINSRLAFEADDLRDYLSRQCVRVIRF